ncbi:hypothetical protein E4K67_22345 [Desulfosporosinus fructosivorans]|uniref:Right-handed parallel beta-helix repeat-containing protein n=1 Tax=Desulfosporosinus fructosivorans TaxID=2018669 RepID=A0A4Z0QYI3_9FIRM|nr:hypothetical protein [Desulfosporosinus fructosivorans]TGE35861.1 hypothetical protein E4K67_22345 [Desulfosporosinus fructosivorans]
MSLSSLLLRSSGAITIAPFNSLQKNTARVVLKGINDSDDINNIMDMLQNGGKLQFLDGTINLQTPVRPKSKINIEGSGESTLFKAVADINAFENTEYIEWFNLSDLSIDMDRENNNFVSGGTALHLSVTHSTIRHVDTKNSKFNLKLNYDDFAGDNSGLLNRIEHCNFQDSSEISVCWGWRVTDSWFCFNNVGSLGANMKIQGAIGRFIGNHFDGGTPEYNVYMPDGARAMLFEGNIFEQGLKGSIYVSGSVFDLVVTSNIFSNAGYLDPGADVIHIEGLMDGVTKSKNITLNSNLFKKNPSNPFVKHCINIKQAESISIMGNSFGDGYNTAQPVGIETATVSNYEVLGNCGNNGIVEY